MSEDISMADPILRERDGHVITLTLNRPEQGNVISSQEMIAALEGALAAINVDESVRAVILTGAGRAFSAGGDVKEMVSPEGLHFQPPYASRRWYRTGIQRIPEAIYDLEVPLIAAVNGYAVGAGNDLACMCDIRLAAESARFATGFTRVGLIPGDGGAFFLSRVVGYARAAEMVFTGEMLDANQALAIGLVSRVVPDDQLLAEARLLAHKIAAHPPHALRLSKRLLREAQHASLDLVLELSANMQAIAHSTQDHFEAVSALVEDMKAQKN
jgi:enoyl-CoA hydratase/carnithine racemase